MENTPAIITLLGTLFTTVLGWAGDVVTFMTASGHELLLISVGFFVVGGAIGLVKRIIG